MKSTMTTAPRRWAGLAGLAVSAALVLTACAPPQAAEEPAAEPGDDPVGNHLR